MNGEAMAAPQKRMPIFTRSVKGKFRRFKWSMLVLAYAVYFLLPWLPWTRQSGPSQPILFDIPGRRFYVFDLVMYPQDVLWLAMLLFIAAIFLFFVTGLVGRAFCGYYCFQTLWTDFFIWIEGKIQGERPARIRLHKQPWNAEKALKLGATHFAWLLVSFWTAFTFVAYYAPAGQLLREFFVGAAPAAAYTTTGILTFTTYLAAGFMREQICAFVCPYGRFQSVMYAPQTLAVHYDARRGEGEKGRLAPRQGLKTLEERHAQGHGDCVDCGYCVQVCPAGIDIRDGLQYRCISCGLCIDACNQIMDSAGFPRGLIRYDSEENLARPVPAKPHIELRNFRVIGYGIALALMVGFLVYNIATHQPMAVVVNQVRQPLYTTLANGDVRDAYHIRITNSSRRDEVYAISAKGLPAGALQLAFHDVPIKTGRSVEVYAWVRLGPQHAAEISRFHFVVTPRSEPDKAWTGVARFFSAAGEADGDNE